jgi:hypothetical protein
MSATVKILGITDERNTCDKCGKRNLKCCVALSIDGGEPVFYGRDCAARAIYGRTDAGKMTRIERIARALSLGADLIDRSKSDPRWTGDKVAAWMHSRSGGYPATYDKRAGTVSLDTRDGTVHVLRMHEATA